MAEYISETKEPQSYLHCVNAKQLCSRHHSGVNKCATNCYILYIYIN